MPAVRQRLFRQNPLNLDSPKFPVLRYTSVGSGGISRKEILSYWTGYTVHSGTRCPAIILRLIYDF